MCRTSVTAGSGGRCAEGVGIPQGVVHSGAPLDLWVEDDDPARFGCQERDRRRLVTRTPTSPPRRFSAEHTTGLAIEEHSTALHDGASDTGK